MDNDKHSLDAKHKKNLIDDDKYLVDKLRERLEKNTPQIDWKHWLSLPLWTAVEAVYLLNLNAPISDNEYKKLLDKDSERKFSSVKTGIDQQIMLAEREIQAGFLTQPISPTNWIEWAQNKGIEIPSQLRGLLIEAQESELYINHSKDLFGLKIIDEQYIIRKANDGSDTYYKETYDNLKVAFNQKLSKGQYTLNDAAMALEMGARISAKDMVKKLVLAAENGQMKMFDPDTGARYLYGEEFNPVVRDFYEVTTYSELNKWIDNNEPLIAWRFPEPESLELLSAMEKSNNQVIKIKPKTNRYFRLYAEIVEIENYKNIGRNKIIEQLKSNIGKDGTCVTSVTTTNINWLDWQGNKQVTSFENLSTWLRRQNSLKQP